MVPISIPMLPSSFPYDAYIAGMFAGWANTVVGHPFDTGKVRAQAGVPVGFKFSEKRINTMSLFLILITTNVSV